MVDIPFELKLPATYKREYKTLKQTFDLKTDEFPVCVSKVVEHTINMGLFKKECVKYIFHKLDDDGGFEYTFLKIDEKGHLESGKV